jgi:hypothetical protein
MFETARNITLGKDISYRGKKNSCTLKASQPSSTTLHHCTSLSAIDAASALRAPRRRIFSFSQAGRSSSSRMADQRWEEEKNGCEKRATVNSTGFLAISFQTTDAATTPKAAAESMRLSC